MYFERTEIQNFKGIEKMDLEFSSGVNLLIGNNGVGKTTVLEAGYHHRGGILPFWLGCSFTGEYGIINLVQ